MTIKYTDMMNTAKSGDFYGFTDSVSGITSQLEDLQVPGIDVSAITSALQDSTSTICSRTKDLTSHMPMIMGARSVVSNANALDAMGTGQTLDGTDDDPISRAFPGGDTSGTSRCKPGAVSVGGTADSFKNAFKPITEGVKDAREAISHIQSQIGAVVSGVTTDVTTGLSVLSGEAQAALSSIQAKAGELKSKMEGYVAEAEAAISDAIATVKAHSFMNLFNNSDPCAQEVMGTVASGGMVNTRALEIANTGIFKDTGQEAVATVQTGAVIPSVDTSADKPVTIDITVTSFQLYTQSEIDGLKDSYNAILKEQATINTSNAKWLRDNIEKFKADSNYTALRDAAKVDESHLMGNLEAGATQADIDAWIPVANQYLPLRTYYNEQLVPQSQAITAKAKAAYNEYNMRLAFGKTPYTAFKFHKKTDYPISKQTTILDSGI